MVIGSYLLVFHDCLGYAAIGECLEGCRIETFTLCGSHVSCNSPAIPSSLILPLFSNIHSFRQGLPVTQVALQSREHGHPMFLLLTWDCLVAKMKQDFLFPSVLWSGNKKDCTSKNQRSLLFHLGLCWRNFKIYALRTLFFSHWISSTWLQGWTM